jgi:glutaredoxin
MDAALVVYTRPDCLYSEKLIADLIKDGVEFKEVDLSLYPELADEVAQLAGGRRVTPVMVEGDNVVVGYNGIGCAF